MFSLQNLWTSLDNNNSCVFINFFHNIYCLVGGKPIPISHMAVQQQQAGSGGQTLTAAGGTTVVKQQQPMVAKVLTNTQGQVISMESLVAHQKQHGTLPQGKDKIPNKYIKISYFCNKITTYLLRFAICGICFIINQIDISVWRDVYTITPVVVMG